MLRFLTICFVLSIGFSASAAEIGEDGLHKQKWFSTSFRDVAEDLTDAAAAGKRLVLIFEQRGCIYCKKLHKEVFSDKKISDYTQEFANFQNFATSRKLYTHSFATGVTEGNRPLVESSCSGHHVFQFRLVCGCHNCEAGEAG